MLLRPGLGALPIGAMIAAGGAVPTIALDFKAALDSRVVFTRAGSAAYTTSAGALAYATTDVPRIDYNPNTHAAIGTLLEGATSNLSTFSEDPNNAAWSKAGVTVTTNNSVAPDGVTSADKLVETTATSAHSDSTVMISPVSGNTYTGTFWAKAGERSLVQWVFGSGPFGTNAWVCFDLSNGTILFQASSITAASITLYGDYYLCRATAVCTATIASRNVIALANNSTNGALRIPSYTGTAATGLTIWGVQCEIGAGTSYVPTSSTAASRVADVATMAGTDFAAWWPASSGSIVVKARPASIGTCPIWEANDGTTNNVIRIYSASGSVNVLVVAGGVEQALLSLGAFTAGTEITVSFMYGTNAFSATLNGGTAVTDTSGTVPVVDRCRFGSDPFGNCLNGQLVDFKAYA